MDTDRNGPDFGILVLQAVADGAIASDGVSLRISDPSMHIHVVA